MDAFVQGYIIFFVDLHAKVPWKGALHDDIH